MSVLGVACAVGEADPTVTVDATTAVDADVSPSADDVVEAAVATDAGSDVAVDAPVADLGSTPDAPSADVADVVDVAVDASVDAPIPGDAFGCFAPLAVCDGVCVGIDNDPQNCGSCGNVCFSDERCLAGVCRGPTGYTVATDVSALRWIDACSLPGHVTALTDTNGGTYAADLPFRFRYWGTPVPAHAVVTVTPDGYVTFQHSPPTPANGIVPNHGDGVDAVIAAQWRDLATRGAGMCIATAGNVGARTWVVEWADVHYVTSALGHLNFEVVLNETTNVVDLAYGSQTLPEPATVGLEDWAGANAVIPFGVPQPILFSGRNARFTPH